MRHLSITPADRIERQAGELHDAMHQALRPAPKCDEPTAVTIYSMNDKPEGQWIIGDITNDPRRVALRLRQAADCLDGGNPL